jgi:hypothetical protein
MKRNRLEIVLILLRFFSLPELARGQDLSLNRLAEGADFTAGRVTSADKSGGNGDTWVIPPGETRMLADLTGPGSIVHFRDNITGTERHHLRLHILRIYWDGERQPSVEVPIGHFFGVGFGFTETYGSALVCIDQRRGSVTDPAASGAARNSHVPMPFAHSARLTITNEGKAQSLHWFEISYRRYAKMPRDQLYFHAQYRQATPPPEGPFVILEVKGTGHLIGCVLIVKNNDGGWWGEGDEIAYIDGRRTIQGTGTEDYFVESYGLRRGSFPYFGVTLLEGAFTTAYRWRVPDPVTFRQSIRLLIEHGDGNPPFRSGNFYYSVAYWYQTEPHAVFPKLASPAERVNWALSSGY